MTKFILTHKLKIAGEITHRHEFLADFLANILGLDHDTASADAFRIEHAMSQETIGRLRAVAEFIEGDPRRKLEWQKDFPRFCRKLAQSESE